MVVKLIRLFAASWIVGLLIPLIQSTPRNYDGDQVLAVDIKTDIEWQKTVAILNEIIPVQEVDVWKEPSIGRGRPGHVLVQRQHIDHVTRRLNEEQINYKIAIDDVQRIVSETMRENDAIRNRQAGSDVTRAGGRARDINGTFPRYDDVVAWMEETELSFPLIASTFSIGLTLENRPMQILKLGLPGVNKWRVWIDAGLHAREWLAPTTALFVANQLISGYVTNDITVMHMLRMFDFHIMPVANPDGYEYCHTNERLWRKNRRPVDAGCVGVDLNRNFGFQWGGVNADQDPCSNLYMGPFPESEIEVQNIINYILPDAPKYLMYKAYHTWGEQFFTRWDYTDDVQPEDHPELFDLAARAVNSINFVHGEAYEAGIAPEIMYPFAGSSSDWARGVANIKYPFLTELRDSDGGYAFVAPPSEITPCGQENWAGLQSVLVYIMEKWEGTHPPTA